MFVDLAVITVKAGDGGPGCVAFRREKFEPKGGPCGGNGGRGGDVILVTDEGCNTLLDFRGRPEWEAERGGMGKGKQMTGPDAPARIVRVPPGTLVYDNASGELLADMLPGTRYVAAVGGNGGFGNEHYKTSTNQAPTHAHPGFPGQVRELRLELKLIADVGLIGMPNAGKSTLLAAVTKATPKIADYPFTTLSPQLGVAELDPQRRIVLADIPGLIEGASEGHGLGLDFLRHIERTRVLVHLLDVMPPEGTPAANYRTIREELYKYSPALAEREEIIVLNKLDLLPDDDARADAVKRLRADLKLGRDAEVVGISGAARMHTRELLEKLWTVLNRKPRTWAIDPAEAPPARALRDAEPVAVATRQSAATGIVEPKPAPKVNAEPKPKTKPKTKAKTSVKPKPKARAKPKSKIARKPAAKRQIKAKAKPKANAKSRAGPARSAARPAGRSKPAARRSAGRAKPAGRTVTRGR